MVLTALPLTLCNRHLAVVLLEKLVYEYLLWIEAIVNVRWSIMQAACTKTIFCLGNRYTPVQTDIYDWMDGTDIITPGG